jgi:hypothetical protein
VESKKILEKADLDEVIMVFFAISFVILARRTFLFFERGWIYEKQRQIFESIEFQKGC